MLTFLNNEIDWERVEVREDREDDQNTRQIAEAIYTRINKGKNGDAPLRVYNPIFAMLTKCGGKTQV